VLFVATAVILWFIKKSFGVKMKPMTPMLIRNTTAARRKKKASESSQAIISTGMARRRLCNIEIIEAEIHLPSLISEG